MNLSGPEPQTAAGTSFYERCVRGLLRAYKLTLSPLIGRQCRFAPTCSEYAAEALIGHGPWRGSALTVKRLCRCHPWGGAGYDPPPPPRQKAESQARDWKCET
ncbi:MAG: membrane protein insertion efficiency factor YidD [Alphaproteobacteria bacterium]|nr:membrane protein insertion efficiency factor YidD [Alphaproteobacteria bacterium]MBU1514589.1 membrane protein insertion efficiency factor YidD [Alphaproteobacteria bacterium]MBU2096779.1 membrane protein insertion efficiency factor YidD [Alphaproteobacteria bacterium]MBU2152497.1 membrane protein insertion efficiency factor YidD [Alphaproteobacteria bacterium]MBU2306588.1 membrane protein insertion efficiency factor YidD [Alphaproteobacteria bacterium]